MLLLRLMHRKIHVLNLYIQIYCIHSSLHVLILILPTSEWHFAQAARTTWKAEQTWRVESLDLVRKMINSPGWELKYCSVHRQSFENDWLYIARNMTVIKPVILHGMWEQQKVFLSLYYVKCASGEPTQMWLYGK